jgi:Gpi18-like mannosyltransferase
MLIALLPAWIAGRSLIDLLLIYPSQAGQYEQLTMHAPTIFAWIPDSGRFYNYFYPAGLIMAALTGIYFSLIVYRSHRELTLPILVELALIIVMLMPFLLPKMHERNFYPADIISIIFVFYFPQFFFVPIVMSVISFFSYQPTLFEVEPLPISLLALLILFLIVFLIRHAVTQLFDLGSKTEKFETQ